MKKIGLIGISLVFALIISACTTSKAVYDQSIINELDEHDVAVFSTPKRVQMIVMSDHMFVPGVNVVREDKVPVVATIAQLLNRFEGTPIFITAHTDDIGTFKERYNRSMAQAKNLTKELILLGVNPERIHTSALGDKKPIAKNNTVMGSSDNRRVDIVVFREHQS